MADLTTISWALVFADIQYLSIGWGTVIKPPQEHST